MQTQSPKFLNLRSNSPKKQLVSRQQVKSDADLNVIDSVLEEESFEIQINEYESNNEFRPSEATSKRLGGEGEIELQDDEDDVVLFIESKYCTVCNIEQPLRCKHCKSCDICVATYDHHCPWIGNCVGERNRKSFFWFLLCQFIQLVIALISIYVSLTAVVDSEAIFNQFVLVTICIILLPFTGLVFSLFVFHLILAAKNLTSCKYFIFHICLGESLSWMKITYMKVWPKKYGSPFSKGSAN